ncbi:hypothetical protein QJS10_CPA06g00697 [Acorus calamus]|uniref:Uncharacterized protein n=1 Tax=Acorus calamus TaxID=4465 RepID=A0AAV9EN06_ACOCL|nr:hypothetical protein QJS10_CPA06g00697 [Acorus calamus]
MPRHPTLITCDIPIWHVRWLPPRNPISAYKYRTRSSFDGPRRLRLNMAGNEGEPLSPSKLRSDFMAVVRSRRSAEVPLTVEPAKPVESPVYQAALDPAAFEVMKSCPRAVVDDLEEKLKEENLYLMTEAGEQGRLPVLILSLKGSKLQRRPAIVILHSSYKSKEWLRPLLEALVSSWRNGDTMPFIYDTGFRWAIDNDKWKARVDSIKPLFEEARIDLGKSEIDKEVVDKVWERIAPGLTTQFDAPYTIPVIAPRPQLIINGADDPRCPLMGLDIPVSKAQEAYKSSNCEEIFKLIAEEGIGHRMTTSMVKEASDWFDKFL